MDNNEEAVLDCRRAIKLNKDFTKAYYRQAVALFNMHDVENAKHKALEVLNIGKESIKESDTKLIADFGSLGKKIFAEIQEDGKKRNYPGYKKF